MCAELADLGMQLARAAAARTLDSWAEPAPAPAHEPTQSTEPPPTQPEDSQLEADAAQASRRPGSPRAQTPTYRPTDPAILFTRLAATVRDCIALETRIAANAPNPQTATRAAALRADPRRTPLRNAFAYILKNHPDRAHLHPQTSARIDDELTDDPDQTIEPAFLLCSLCQEYGIEIDWAHIPDEFMFMPPPPSKPRDDQDGEQPDPHATSPP